MSDEADGPRGRVSPLTRVVALVAGLVCATVSGAPASFRAAAYSVQWSADAVEVLSPDGALLTRWPMGSSCVPADPDWPVTPSALTPNHPPVLTFVAGAPELTWRWRFAAPAPIAEQAETARLLPDRIELRLRVRWRGAVPRLVRMNYGGRLAAGCCDLEGLWRAGEARRVEPVPGVFQDTGTTRMAKRVRTTAPGPLELVMGGVDDGDVTFWDRREIGRTPSDSATLSWTKVRRYPIPAEAVKPGAEAEVLVQVQNAAGNGGFWRGPVVLGPRAAMASSLQGDGWTRATATGKALYQWCPDTWRQALAGRFTVSLTSRDRTREWVPENVTTGGRFQTPPYVVAIEGDHGWWGIGTLDLPRAEDGLRVEWRDGTLTCPFLLATEPGTRPGGWTTGPRVAILPGGSKAGVLRTYLGAVEERGASRVGQASRLSGVETVPERQTGETPVLREPRPEWWSGPCYCTWGDQCYASALGKGSDLGTLNEANLGRWLGALKERGLAAPLVTLDAGWWQLPKQVIRDLHAAGRHVTLWTQPHWGPDTSQQPERAIRDFDGRPMTYDANNWILDYTSPVVREHMAGDFRSYVAPEGWGADGIKLDFCYTAGPVWATHADPAWGVGEQYRARVLQFVYATIKAAKPDALVTGGTANPLFGRVEDVCRLNEDWFDDPQVFRRRAEAVLALGEWVECDDWNAYGHYLESQAVERPIWGTFTLMSALHRGDHANKPQPLSAEWAGRLSAIGALAGRIPVRDGQRCVYDADRGIAKRLGPKGELLAIALPLDGMELPLQALVVCEGDTLRVCAVAAGTVVLPTRRRVREAAEVLDDGRRRAAKWEEGKDGVRLKVRDSGGEVGWYEVRVGGAQGTRPFL